MAKSASSTAEKEPKESDEGLLRARRIRIHPTVEQRDVLKKWFGVARFVYNQAVERARQPGVNNTDLTLKSLRSQFMTDNSKEWLTAVPYDVRDNALRDFNKARKSFFAKRSKAQSINPDAVVTASFKFRSKRLKQQCLVIRGRDWGRKHGIYSTLFGSDKMKSSEPIPAKLDNDFRVVLNRVGHYFLCIPRKVPIRSENQAPKSVEGVVSLDPGVRTFQTCFSADGLVTEWGKEDMSRLFKDLYVADRLQGRWMKSKGIKRRRRHRAWLKRLIRIHNKVGEIHKKLATWLCENHRVVLIPKFETQRMVRRQHRKLNSKTVRGMCNWSHYGFRQLLLNKAELFPWCKIIVCDEAYTSKTCGRCGLLHEKLGSNKNFLCPSCKYNADRDISAARNIMLRYLTLEVGSSL